MTTVNGRTDSVDQAACSAGSPPMGTRSELGQQVGGKALLSKAQNGTTSSPDDAWQRLPDLRVHPIQPADPPAQELHGRVLFAEDSTCHQRMYLFLLKRLKHNWLKTKIR